MIQRSEQRQFGQGEWRIISRDRRRVELCVKRGSDAGTAPRVGGSPNLTVAFGFVRHIVMIPHAPKRNGKVAN